MNFDLPYFNSKKVIYIGQGREKSSFQQFVVDQELSDSITVIDSVNDINALDTLAVTVDDQTIVVKGPEVPGNKMPCAYTTVTRIFFDCTSQLGVKTVGVTGTRGKTTTSALLAHILKNAGFDTRLCSNAGNPMLDALQNTTNETVIIAELTSFQLAELQQSPDIAVITNLGRDHTDYHGSLEEYWEAKHNIVRYMNEDGTVVYNPSDEAVLHWTAELKIDSIAITPDDSIDMTKCQLIGDHNKLNFIMARTVAQMFKVNPSTITQSFQSFEPVRHRLQPVRTVRGITYVDDAIGTTPEATIAGITALIHSRGPVGCVMLGGKNSGQDYTELVQLLYRVAIPKLVCFPDTGPLIQAMIREVDNYSPDIFDATDMDEAVQWAHDNTPSGSICLLSTAAPSTVLWQSFEEKGSLFQQAVLALPNA